MNRRCAMEICDYTEETPVQMAERLTTNNSMAVDNPTWRRLVRALLEGIGVEKRAVQLRCMQIAEGNGHHLTAEDIAAEWPIEL